MKKEQPIALVTGSSRGIGKAIALELARCGHSIIINYYDEGAGAIEVCDQISKLGQKVIAVRADVADRSQVHSMLEKIQRDFGRVDVLVNNAGITKDRSLAKMQYEDWDAILDVNLSGPFNLMKEVLPLMIQNKSGSIVNISSIVGMTGAFGQANYAASKAGLIGLTRSASLELSRYGIRINAVCPGYIDTEMLRAVPEQVRADIQKKIPLSRFGDPEEIAKAVRFLVTEGTYITGQCLHINGGLYLG